MLPLHHTLGSSGPNHGKVGQAGKEDGSNGGQNRPPIIRVQNAGDPSCSRGSECGGSRGVGKGKNDGDGGLDGEVDGEDLGHERGKLRAGKDLEGNDATHERLCWVRRLVGSVRFRDFDSVTSGWYMAVLARVHTWKNVVPSKVP